MLYKIAALCLLVQIAHAKTVHDRELTECAATGEQCDASHLATGACCGELDKCEAVNDHYNKCVTQPHCAAKEQQCAGKGDSVMEETACCDDDHTCVAVNEWYSKCANSSALVPPLPPSPPAPPTPPPATCAADEAQCGGPGFSPLDCCEDASECMVVNEYYSKCVAVPTCAADSALCKGTGAHALPEVGCCNAAETCVPWGDAWSVCRDAAHAQCSMTEEQCAGTGDSQMAEKGCCDPADTCVKVNQYYSKCSKSAASALAAKDSCPGLAGGCPRA